MSVLVGGGVLVAVASTGSDRVSVDQLEVGQCVRTAADGGPDDMHVVDCADVHQVEVVGVFDLPPGPWPGDGAAAQQADEARCVPMLRSYEGGSDRGIDAVHWYFPLEDDWSRGWRRVACLAETLPGSTGSVRQPAPGR